MTTSMHATIQPRSRAVGGPPVLSAGGSTGSSSKEEVHMNTKRFIAVALLIVGSGLAPQVARAQQGVTRTDLLQHDLSVSGREVIQVHVEIAPGVTFLRHSHPGEELVFVTEGVLEYRLDGRPPVTLTAGEVLFIPAGTPHAVTNIGSGNASELATYIVEKGKPLLVLASERPSGDRIP